jgi:hypothetical protein
VAVSSRRSGFGQNKKRSFLQTFFLIQMSGTNDLLPVGLRLKVIALNDIAQ